MPSFDASRNRLLALIATILGVAALRATYRVTTARVNCQLVVASSVPEASRGSRGRKSAQLLDVRACLAVTSFILQPTRLRD
jgi:hypothetical protein